MKNIKFVLVVVIIIQFQNIYSQHSEKYKITDIDSTTSNYIVSLKKGNVKSIVISPKFDTLVAKNKIQVGKRYRLILDESTLKNLSPPDKLNSIKIDGKVIWTIDDDFEIYFTDDLVGLHYTPSFKKCNK